MSARNTIVSCPGKIMLAGGYVVTDRAYRALVVPTSARVYVTVCSAACAAALPTPLVVVHSPQFPVERPLVFPLDPSADPPMAFPPSLVASSPFVVCALDATLAWLRRRPGAHFTARLMSGRQLLVTIKADNDFYNQSGAITRHGVPAGREGLRMLPYFCSPADTIAMVGKTGLGSSAAIVAALVAALLHYFGVDDSTNGWRNAHALAQLAHSRAQGNVGSGFDVAAAFYGPLMYRRYSPSLELGEEASSAAERTDNFIANFDAAMQNIVLHPRLDVLLIDSGAGGTKTPGMVNKVSAWRKSQISEASQIWAAIAVETERASAMLGALAISDDLNDPSTNLEIDMLCSTLASEWAPKPTQQLKNVVTKSQTLRDLLVSASQALANVRCLMREMGKASKIPVEPPECTAVLDACAKLPGVIGVGVPGAGGHDAMYILYLVNKQNERATENAVEQLLANISPRPILLACTMGRDGLRVEKSNHAVP